MKRFSSDHISYEDGTQIPFTEIRQRYAKSEYGRILNEQLRWEPAMRLGTTPY